VTQAELLEYAAAVFEELGVVYMIGGSQASIYYGEPRFTQDIDIVADLELQHLPSFVAAYPSSDFYLDEDAVREAIDTQGQFNIIHPQSGLKIDVFVSKDTEYDRLRLARRCRLPLTPRHQAYFARPEDIVLYKLLYFREGESEVHVRDVLGILEVSGATIDMDYISDWVRRLGLGDVWDAVLRRARDGSAG
jgi:hypothetical protein